MVLALHSHLCVPTNQDHELGRTGEELACQELAQRGYAILARGYRTRYGEIDIVAQDRSVLVFVEVKTRSSVAYGGPLAAVTPRKQQRVIRMALDYLARRRLSGVPCRFDVVGVAVKDGTPGIEVVTDAFGRGG